jgi:hypothetical protein
LYGPFFLVSIDLFLTFLQILLPSLSLTSKPGLDVLGWHLSGETGFSYWSNLIESRESLFYELIDDA